MDAIRPFSLTLEETKDIRNIFKIVSSGGNPYSYPETKIIFPKYKTIFDIFEICIDSRYGNILHLPFSGGIVDQGVKTMESIRLLQSLFRQKIIEEEKRKGNFRH